MIIIPSTLRSQVTTCRTQHLATCWKISLVGSATVYRFTDAPQELQLREAEHGARLTYTPTKGVDASASRNEDELSASNKEIRGVIDSSAITAAALRAGLFDGAQVDEYLVDRRIPWVAYIAHRRYFIKTVRYSRGNWEAEADAMPGFLDLPVGDLWTPICRVDLFSPKCGLTETDWDNTTAAVAEVVSQRLVIRFTYSIAGGLSAWGASGWADDGTVLFTSGANNGLRTAIKTHVDTADGGTMTLHFPTAFDVQVGDTATLFPGCNKKSGVERDPKGVLIPGHCKDKFNNLVNFQGEPYIPGRDKAFVGMPFR